MLNSISRKTEFFFRTNDISTIFEKQGGLRMQESGKSNNGSKKWKWYHGVLFYAGVQAATFGVSLLAKRFIGAKDANVRDSIISSEENDAFYNNLKQPVFAPPDWAFPVVWAINNASCIYGLLRVANMPEETEGRDAFLKLQFASWVEFCSFNAAFFGLKSPINAAAVTVSYAALTAASVYVATARLKDQRTALSLLTVSAWLALAAPTSIALAAWNEDEFYGAPALLDAPENWVK